MSSLIQVSGLVTCTTLILLKLKTEKSWGLLRKIEKPKASNFKGVLLAARISQKLEQS